MTTPEKWDSATRRSFHDLATLAQVQLLLVDEVHLLGEDRGPCLEAVIARMQTLRTLPQVEKERLPCTKLRIMFVVLFDVVKVYRF